MRRFLLAAVAALSTGCAGAEATPKSAADAYHVARVASDSLAVALDASALLHRLRVLERARAGAARCAGQGAARLDCEHAAKVEAYEGGRPIADKIDVAAKAQNKLADTLKAYAECTDHIPGDLCHLNALTQALAQTPAVTEAVEAARKAVQNVSSQ